MSETNCRGMKTDVTWSYLGLRQLTFTFGWATFDATEDDDEAASSEEEREW